MEFEPKQEKLSKSESSSDPTLSDCRSINNNSTVLSNVNAACIIGSYAVNHQLDRTGEFFNKANKMNSNNIVGGVRVRSGSYLNADPVCADADIVAISAMHGPVEVPVSELTARMEAALMDAAHREDVQHTENDDTDEKFAQSSLLNGANDPTVDARWTTNSWIGTIGKSKVRPPLPFPNMNSSGNATVYGSIPLNDRRESGPASTQVGVVVDSTTPAYGSPTGSVILARTAGNQESIGKNTIGRMGPGAVLSRAAKAIGMMGNGRKKDAESGAESLGEETPSSQHTFPRISRAIAFRSALEERRAPYAFDVWRAQHPLLVIEFRRGNPNAIYHHMRRHEILTRCREIESASEVIADQIGRNTSKIRRQNALQSLTSKLSALQAFKSNSSRPGISNADIPAKGEDASSSDVPTRGTLPTSTVMMPIGGFRNVLFIPEQHPPQFPNHVPTALTDLETETIALAQEMEDESQVEDTPGK